LGRVAEPGHPGAPEELLVVGYCERSGHVGERVDGALFFSLDGRVTRVKRAYSDIIDRLGIPQWYDGNGCPRYCRFHPSECGVYDRIVALIEIRCQACGASFRVAAEIDPYESEPPLPNDPQLAAKLADFAHYGDPPRHGGDNCLAGDTTNSCPRRVIEWWDRTNALDWQRRPEFEIEIRASWDSDDDHQGVNKEGIQI
jgi:hypothetical protein